MENQNQVEVVENKSAQAFRKTAVGTGALALGLGAAHAEAIDVSSVVTTITDGVTTVSAIGLAVLSLVVVIKVFKWARSAM